MDMKKKHNLLNFNRKKMCDFFSSIGEKAFRAYQIMQWIYKLFCNDFSKMSNIKISLRKKLYEVASISSPKFIKEQKSLDGTIKWSVQVKHGFVETVYIPERSRSTLCISTQVGCALSCSFCATGKTNFNGNLSVSEIIGQVWEAWKKIKERKNSNFVPITNIVFMGMGEPLLNVKNVITSLQILFDDFAFGFSKRRITVSTSGIVPGLKELSNYIDVNLAISLHAPNDKIRSLIMPINKKYNINSVLLAVKGYLKNSKANHGGVTIEYVMLKNINDSMIHAEELSSILIGIPSKINLIPWNYFFGSQYMSSSFDVIKLFSRVLKKNGLVTTIRKNRGSDIKAACGQLFENF